MNILERGNDYNNMRSAVCKCGQDMKCLGTRFVGVNDEKYDLWRCPVCFNECKVYIKKVIKDLQWLK